MQDDRDVIDAVEAAFGTGALELIAELEAAEQAVLQELSADSHEVGSAAAIASPACAAGQLCAVGERVAGPPQPEQREPEQQALLMFETADTRFGLSLANVVEIQQVPRITRITRGPQWLRGLANLRGTIISVVDLQLLLGGSPAPRRNGGRLIVVRSPGNSHLTGLLVDSVSRLLVVATDAIEKTAATADRRDHCVRGMIECEGQSVTVLDLETLLRSSEMRQLQIA